jgi:hypothetical protein
VVLTFLRYLWRSLRGARVEVRGAAHLPYSLARISLARAAVDLSAMRARLLFPSRSPRAVLGLAGLAAFYPALAARLRAVAQLSATVAAVLPLFLESAFKAGAMQ